MKAAVLGCGAVGSYYGALLCRAGETVHFLLRSDYATVRRKGVRVRSPKGDFCVQPRCAQTPDEIGAADLVIVALKTTANAALAKLLPPLVGPSTAVLTLQNGLGNEECLARLVAPQQILGGLCFVCLNRVEPGLIQHIDHGPIELGEYAGGPRPRTHDIASLFRRSGVSCSVTDNLRRAHWEKLVWNIPFNGLGVASAAGYAPVATGQLPSNIRLGECLTTDKLLGDPRWETVVRELMAEVIAAGRALGLEVRGALAEEHIARTRTMGAYKPSTLLDFERGQPIELESLFLEPMRRARATDIPTPRLAALCSLLEQLEEKRTR